MKIMKKAIVVVAVAAVSFASCGEQMDENKNTDKQNQNVLSPEEEAAERIEEEHAIFKSGYADSVNRGLIEPDTFIGSARRVAEGKVSGCDVTVNYGSPGKRGRVLWNGLVSYDQVWVSGSHWATAVTFSKPVKVNKTVIKPGTYAFFTIPGREEWTLIINEIYDQHLAEEYDKNLDLVRVKVKPQQLDETIQRLTYSVDSKGSRVGEISMKWDQIKVSLPFEVLK